MQAVYLQLASFYFVFLLSYRILQNSGIGIDSCTTNHKKTDATTDIIYSSSRNSQIFHKQQAFQIAYFYEYTFLACNTSLFHGYLSIQTNRPLLAATISFC